MAKPNPAPLRERDITRQIAREYYKEFDSLIESDVIIVGAGPSGLICAHDIAKMGFRTLVVEQSLALGGGFWHGGYLMNKATICEPANEILEEIGVPCKKITECEGMYMVDPPHATGALVAAAVLAVALPGCAGISDDTASNTMAAPGMYNFYTCAQLATQIKASRTRLLEIEQLMARSAQSPGGAIWRRSACAVAYPFASRQIGPQTTDAADFRRAASQCSIP